MNDSTNAGEPRRKDEPLTFYLREAPTDRDRLRALESAAFEVWLSRGTLVPNEPGGSEGRYMVEYRSLDRLRKMLAGQALWSRGRPLVCIVAEQVDGSSKGEQDQPVAFWVHFCLSVLNTTTKSPLLGGTDTLSKQLGRKIALMRLAERKEFTLRTKIQSDPDPDWWHTRQLQTRVGLTIPIYGAQLLSLEEKSARRAVTIEVQRTILGYVADSSYHFPATAQRLAGKWLARKGLSALA